MEEKRAGKPIFSFLKYNKRFRSEYEEILRTFGFDEQKDAMGRDLLLKIIPTQEWHDIVLELQKKIEKKWVVICGGGPTGPEELEFILQSSHSNIDQNCVFIAADGAARYLIAQGIVPVAVFTDLDGITPEIMNQLNQAGTIFIIHSHGDNIEALKTFKPAIKLLKFVIGTTQTLARPPIINPGGFTDGDRILYFLANLPPIFKILLIGMDFGTVIGQFSKSGFTTDMPATPFKAKKLQIAINLLSTILPTMQHAIFRFEEDYPFPGVGTISREEFQEKLQIN